MCNGFDLIDNRFLIHYNHNEYGTVARVHSYNNKKNLKLILECLWRHEYLIITNKDDKRENTFFITHFKISESITAESLMLNEKKKISEWVLEYVYAIIWPRLKCAGGRATYTRGIKKVKKFFQL